MPIASAIPRRPSMIRAILLGGRSSEFTLSSFYLAKER
jgi:hypothetical protein